MMRPELLDTSTWTTCIYDLSTAQNATLTRAQKTVTYSLDEDPMILEEG